MRSVQNCWQLKLIQLSDILIFFGVVFVYGCNYNWMRTWTSKDSFLKISLSQFWFYDKQKENCTCCQVQSEHFPFFFEKSLKLQMKSEWRWRYELNRLFYYIHIHRDSVVLSRKIHASTRWRKSRYVLPSILSFDLPILTPFWIEILSHSVMNLINKNRKSNDKTKPLRKTATWVD